MTYYTELQRAYYAQAAQIAAQQAEIERLRAALESYGTHTPSCDADHDPRWACTCGWDATRAALEKRT